MNSRAHQSQEPRSNRYILWLEQGAPPPVRGSLSKAEEAANHFFTKMRLACRQLALANDPWLPLNNFLLARQRFYAVLSLTSNQAGVSKRMGPGKVEPWNMQWEGRCDRVSKRLYSQSGKLLQRMRRQTVDRQRKKELTELLEQIKGDFKIDNTIRKLVNEQTNRERHYVRERQALGGPSCSGAVSGIHRDYLKSAKKEAQSRGKTGYLFPMYSEQANAGIHEADHPELRRLLWWESSYAPVPMKAVERMRQLRHQKAKLEGVENYAKLQLDGAVMDNPQRIERTLRYGQEALTKDVKAFRKEVLRYLNNKGTYQPIKDVPWDWPFALSKTSTLPYKDWTKVFPWRETAIKVFNELLQKTGWASVRPPRLSGQGIWSTIDFHIEREDGRRAHLIYAPFRPNENEHSYSAGQACAILNAWDGQDTASTPIVVWIDQSLDKTSMAFSQEDLRVLCHEIGHALHYMALPGSSPEETCFLPTDIFEIPSHLLELYSRDPSTLARWASKNGPPECRRSRHWMKSLNWDEGTALYHYDELRFAQVDMQLHYQMDRSFLDIAKSAWGPLHEEDDSWKRSFIWDTHLACLDYTQTVPKSLARRLVTVPEHGRVNSQVVLDAFVSLIENVLANGVTANLVSQSWRRWTGESFSSSLKTSVISHARQSARITRRATQQLRKKTRSRQQTPKTT